MTDRISEIVLEVADEVRRGMDEHEAIVTIANEYGIRENVLSARLARAYPNGITPPPPSAEENARRRREAEKAAEERNRAEFEAMREFFADHSKRRGLERTLRSFGL